MDGMTMTDQDDKRWQQVITRDVSADGRFFYAVKTTGIYCRPSCPSRNPKRENVRFFETPAAAAEAGFRPCKRCRPDQVPEIDVRLATAAELCRRIEGRATDGVQLLDDLAAQAGYSLSHFQRLFTEIVGVSPQAYADQLRLRAAKTELKSGSGVAQAAYGAGFGSASRLYERSDRDLGMTPASYAKGGRGASLVYGFRETNLGLLMVAATEKGVAFVALGETIEDLIEDLIHDLPEADRTRDDEAIAWALDLIADYLAGGPDPNLPLDIQATAFQAKVWRGLTRIPMGEVLTYKQLADAIGQPTAARAVGLACAKNPVSLIVPCHRAIGSDGALTGYRWGVARKRLLLARERLQNAAA